MSMDRDEQRAIKEAMAKAMKEAGFEGAEVDIIGAVQGSFPQSPEERMAVAKTSVEEMFVQLDNFVITGQEIIDQALPWEDAGMSGAPKIDEVAIMYRTDDGADRASIEMTAVDTIRMFNAAEDHVHTKPHMTHYDVQYRFLENSRYPWRTEVMSIDRGHSPLHEAMWHTQVAETTESEYNAAPVHVSFKVEDKEQFTALIISMARSDMWVPGQFCFSDYGQFSYWKCAGNQDFPMWVKPRINLRDLGGGLDHE